MSQLKDAIGEVRESRPILVSGVYRSGTTFMAALLGAHPRIRAASSTVKFIRFCLHRYGDMQEAENRRRLVEETARRIAVRWELELDVEAVLRVADAHPEPSYALLYDLLMRELLCKGEDASVRWVEKLAMQWSGIPAFLDMFPNGRVVHILRDPRDVTTSYKLMTFEPGNTYLDAAFNCRGAMEAMYDLDLAYRDRVMVVRAEDIAQCPEPLIAKLQAFLDLTPDPAMLDPSKLHAEGEDWASNTSRGMNYDRWPDGRPRWPNQLSRAELLLVELVTQPWLSHYGYSASVADPSAEEWAAAFALIDDNFLRGRLHHWLQTGEGAEGYRSDPYIHEMKIAFPERYAEAAEQG